MSQFKNLPLQDLIRSVVSSATEKLASDQNAETQIRNAVGGQPVASAASDEESEESEFTDADFVEKLASACDFIAQNVNNIEAPQRGVLGNAIAKLAGEEVPPAVVTPDQLSVQAAMGGKQKYKHDKPKSHDAAVSTADSPLNTHGLPGGATLMANDMDKAPGGNNSSVPTKGYPEAGVLHAGPTKTASGLAALAAGMDKEKSAGDIAKETILRKLAGEDVMKASISSGKGASPLVGGGVQKVLDASQTTSSPTDGSGYGNQQRGAVASSEAATNLTKGEAKKPRAKELKEVLVTPAFDPGADSKLREQLRNAGTAGVKIAGAQRELLKQAAAKGLLNQETVNQFKELRKQASVGDEGGNTKIAKLKALVNGDQSHSQNPSTGGL